MFVNVDGVWVNKYQVTHVTYRGLVYFTNGHNWQPGHLTGSDIAAILNGAEYDLDGHITQTIQNTRQALDLARRLMDENKLLKAELEGLRALNNAT